MTPRMCHRYLLVAEIDEPFTGGQVNGIDITPASNAMPTRASLVLAADPDSTIAFAKPGNVVFHGKGAEQGIMLEGGEVHGILHEGQVCAWLEEGDVKVKPRKMSAAALMELIKRVNSQHPNGNIVTGGRMSN